MTFYWRSIATVGLSGTVYRLRDKRRFQSKITIFLLREVPVFNAPAEGFSLELGTGAGVKKN